MMEDKIVPFGKHKGKPIEVLTSDKPYLNWLLAQSWFKEKFLNIYNIVIHYPGEPVDTPEHNKMQIMFLDLNYRLKLVYFLCPEIFERNCHFINNSIVNWLNSKEVERNERNNFLDSLSNPDKSEQLGLYSTALLRYSNPIFENVDVSFRISYGLDFYYEHRGVRKQYINRKICEIKLEIKPTISDDFPSVLRQMKASMPIRFNENNYLVTRYYLLLVGKYTGIGASISEFREYFKTQGYIVIFEDEISDIDIPSYDKHFIFDDKLKELFKSA